MLAGDLAKKVNVTVTNPNIEVSGVSEDSRQIKQNFVFAALAGSKVNGEKFIADAVSAGASAILIDSSSPLLAARKMLETLPVAVFISDNARKTFTLMCQAFYPASPKIIAAVTGTNGKTSVSVFCRQIWEADNINAASMGTIGIISKSFNEEGNLTSPAPSILYRNVNRLAALGVENLAIEASSHGLDQYRLDGLKIQVAGFTNLTRDHLDYHKTMENYLQAKLRLFTEVLDKDGTSVINADIPEASYITKEIKKTRNSVFTYGAKGKELKIISHKGDAYGQNLLLEVFGKIYNIRLPLTGDFQAMNALCAAGMTIAGGMDADKVMESLESLKGAWGRLEKVVTLSNGASVYVDYAHTPDAIENVLRTLRPITTGKLHILMGCGGDRDKGKRPQMGEISSRLADYVIVTDDNPRSEDPNTIREEIMTACPKGKSIAGRDNAIKEAISSLMAGDVLVLAGKGHETGQKIKDQIIPFNDTEEAVKAALAIDKNAVVGHGKDCSAVWSVSELAAAVNGVSKKPNPEKSYVYGVRDTVKTVKVGDAFIDLNSSETETVAAIKKGAKIAIVHHSGNLDLENCILVDNTESALDKMVVARRQKDKIKLFSLFHNASSLGVISYLSAALANKGTFAVIKEKTGEENALKIAFSNLKSDLDFIILENSELKAENLARLSVIAKPDVIIIGTEDKAENITDIFKGANLNALLFIDSSRNDYDFISTSARMNGIRKVIPFRFNRDKAKLLSLLIYHELFGEV
jgi:UDP-N-acetylmuramyl-tripeptide synthetase